MTHPCAVSWCAALATKTFGYCVVHEKNQALHPELTQRQMHQKIVFPIVQTVPRKNDND